jgi:uncharacterized membrane protein
MIKLYEYFGIIGILSILGWVGALVMLVAHVRSRRRTRGWWIGFGLGTLGLVLAFFTFLSVTAIEVDRSAEMKEGMERQKEIRKEEEALEAEKTKQAEESGAQGGIKASGIRFAEDSETDTQDLAGKSKTVKKSDDYLSEMQSSLQEVEPAYRKRGKQQREISGEATTNNMVTGLQPEKVEAAPVRLMKEADANAAKNLGRANYLFARVTFWILLTMVVIDYLSRFNRTFDYLYPLPVANRHIDSIWPKKHAVHAPGRRGEDLRGYLEDVVRKGETFIYFGSRDFWTTNFLPRLRIRKWTQWPLRKVACQPGDNYDSEFIFESAWFNRYCFVVANDNQRACRLADDVAGFLSMRFVTRARAQRTVHVVWDIDPAIAASTLEKLAGLAPETNFKLLVTNPSVTADVFEEVVPA